METKLFLKSLAVVFFALPQIAGAATITFSGLTGANGDPFPSPYTEAGYVVTATSGQWVQGQAFGNPVPSIFDGAGFTPLQISSIEITKAGGGAFTFASVDLASNGDTSYAITGAGFNETGTVGPVQDFTTIASNDSSLFLTSLTITMTPQTGAVSYNIDNIVVNSTVPEPTPGTLAALGVGLLWLSVRARRVSGKSIH
jgi:hypothetical protein